jgi:hypothetical protein
MELGIPKPMYTLGAAEVVEKAGEFAPGQRLTRGKLSCIQSQRARLSVVLNTTGICCLGLHDDVP